MRGIAGHRSAMTRATQHSAAHRELLGLAPLDPTYGSPLRRCRPVDGHGRREAIEPLNELRVLLAPLAAVPEIEEPQRAGERDVAVVGVRGPIGNAALQMREPGIHLGLLAVDPFLVPLLLGPEPRLVDDENRG